jgi:hypothetical protein
VPSAADASAPTGEHAVLVRLDDPADARRAVVHLEILSPPKALRRGPEMWDR